MVAGFWQGGASPQRSSLRQSTTRLILSMCGLRTLYANVMIAGITEGQIMRMRMFVLAVVVMGGCSDDGGEEPQGTEGGPCYGNLTCNPGLTCASNLCVRLADMGVDSKPLPSGQVVTVAGSGKQGFKDGPALSAEFNHPVGVAIDAKGRVFVADWKNHRIRVIHGGLVTTFAGTGNAAFADGPVLSASFNEPYGVAVDATGTVYVADVSNHRIRAIYSGKVTTVVGTGVAGFKDGAASSAQLNSPTGVTIDSAGRLIISDMKNHRIRALESGLVSTIAGSGVSGFADGPASSAKFNHPFAVAVDGGAVYVVGDGKKVRKIVGGMVSTLAASGFNFLRGVAAKNGTVYVTDPINERISVVSGGVASVFAGSGAGHQDGPLATAKFNHPHGISMAPNGELYVGDYYNHRVRMITP